MRTFLPVLVPLVPVLAIRLLGMVYQVEDPRP
jgi:hypothetical protein